MSVVNSLFVVGYDELAGIELNEKPLFPKWMKSTGVNVFQCIVGRNANIKLSWTE